MRAWTRGVRIPRYKEPAASRDILPVVPTGPVFAPLCYGEAETSLPAAAVGAAVHKGEPLGVPREEDDAPAFATVDGVLTDVRSIGHPVFGTIACAVLQPAEEKPAPAKAKKPAKTASRPAADAPRILEAARRAGIIDETDGVPLYAKLSEWHGRAPDILVADGAETEPYASAAWAVLNESAEEVYRGLQLANTVIGAARQHVAVLLPKDRRRALEGRLGRGVVIPVRSKYPAGPLLPQAPDAVVCRVGVQACLALLRAVENGEAHTACVLTVAGGAVANPQNVRVPFGTTAGEILRTCGLASDPQYVIFGDAMTGVAADSLEYPILPGVTCLLALTERPVPTQRPCMGCGRCAKVCHAGLLPYEIVRRLENMHYERLKSLLPEECDGCGACSHVCPAGRDVTAKVLEAGRTRGGLFFNWGDDDDA